MNSVQKFILEIKTRKQYLLNMFKTVEDSYTSKLIAYSLIVYTEIEYILLSYQASVSKKTVTIMDEKMMVEKILPYLHKIQLSSNYLFQSLDYNYANDLLSILSKAYSFSIPAIYVGYHQIVNLTKDFYLSSFSDKISKEALSLIDNFGTLFLDSNNNGLSVAGRSYIDPYYGDIYSLVQKLNNIEDYCGLSHEIFHGLHYKLNPDSIFDSINETKEVGATTIEFILFDFLVSHDISTGNILNKISLLSISNNAYSLQKNMKHSFSTVDFINSFLLLEAKIVGYGIAQEYFSNSLNGEKKLIDYLLHNFSPECLPDYSFLGYSKKEILETAKKIVQERDLLISSDYQKSL